MALVGGNSQRRVARRRHGRGVHVSPFLEQHMPDFDVATRGRLHQRGQTRLRSVLDVRPPVNQQTDDLVAALETRQGQGRIAISLDLKTEYRGARWTFTKEQ